MELSQVTLTRLIEQLVQISTQLNINTVPRHPFHTMSVPSRPSPQPLETEREVRPGLDGSQGEFPQPPWYQTNAHPLLNLSPTLDIIFMLTLL